MNLLNTNVTMTSREIAELTGKNHADVLRDIRNMLEALDLGQSSFADSYFNSQNKEQPNGSIRKSNAYTNHDEIINLIKEKLNLQ